MTGLISLSLLLLSIYIFGLIFLTRKRNDTVPIHVILCIFEAPLTDMWCNFTTCQFNLTMLTTMYAWTIYAVLSYFDWRPLYKKMEFERKSLYAVLSRSKLKPSLLSNSLINDRHVRRMISDIENNCIIISVIKWYNCRFCIWPSLCGHYLTYKALYDIWLLAMC